MRKNQKGIAGIAPNFVGMKLLMIAATGLEIAPFIRHYQHAAEKEWKSLQIEILITGIGLTASAYHITRHVLTNRPDFVLQGGIAGAFSDKLMPGEVVAIKKDTIADAMVKENRQYHSVFEMGLLSKNKFPYKNGWLQNNLSLLKQFSFKKATGISVNEITTGKEKIDYYRQRYQPDLESMEGAALHYVCNMETVPYLQLRSISNKVGERNKRKWWIKPAVENLNKSLIGCINQLAAEQ